MSRKKRSMGRNIIAGIIGAVLGGIALYFVLGIPSEVRGLDRRYPPGALRPLRRPAARCPGLRRQREPGHRGHGRRDLGRAGRPAPARRRGFFGLQGRGPGLDGVKDWAPPICSTLLMSIDPDPAWTSASACATPNTTLRGLRLRWGIPKGAKL